MSYELRPHIVLDDVEQACIRRLAGDLATHDFVGDAEAYVAQAQFLSRALPDRLFRALQQFRRWSDNSGGLLIRGLPTGPVAETPRLPLNASETVPVAAAVLSLIAAVLGEQYGFAPELGGKIVQSILPVRGAEKTQESVNSESDLYIHTEMAFTKNRADYVGLLGLRQDHEAVAKTTLSPAAAVVHLMSKADLAVLSCPRFTTTVDGSFLKGLGCSTGIRIGQIAVLSGDSERPRLRADFAETDGTDSESRAVLARLREAAHTAAVAVRLNPGDLLVVDNTYAFHGRTAFTPRWDGQDRWLLRTFVTRDLHCSVGDRPGDGRIVDTNYFRDPEALPDARKDD